MHLDELGWDPAWAFHVDELGDPDVMPGRLAAVDRDRHVTTGRELMQLPGGGLGSFHRLQGRKD